MFVLSLIGFASAAKYAILLAGSNTFWNYRHQADCFTIYHQLIARGFTSANIAFLAYDDIANDYQNPFKGQIFHTVDHKVNVYPGSDVINYKGNKVTAENFYKVLTSIPTTTDDYVSIYYDNHGGPGILGVPDGCGGYIYGDKLNEAINTMNDKGLYKYLFFSIEACYSGSIGEVFTAPNLATITAANNQESSYAAVYDSTIGTYLSNEFTNYWIDLIDSAPKQTLGELFESLKAQTVESHVCWYGDESLKNLGLDLFLGTPNSKTAPRNVQNVKTVSQRQATDSTLEKIASDVDVKASLRSKARLELLRRKAQTEKIEAVLDMLVKYVDAKNYNKIMNDKTSKITPAYYQILNVFTQRFGSVNPDDYGKFMVLKALAATHSKAEVIEGIFAVL